MSGMSGRRGMIRGLLAVYPEKWRSEYGEEREALLLARPFTAVFVADVLWNALRQRIREAPWRVSAAALFAWTLIGGLE